MRRSSSSRDKRAGFYYSRVSNPTLRQLELLLAELQGRDACLLTGSGVAAIAMPLIALLKSGDHVVHFAEQYQPTRALIGRLLRRFGVASTMLSIDDLDGLERALAATPTRLVVFESPTNPVLKIADIERLTSIARRHGALTLLDNTLAGFHNHGQFDVDLFAHSLTKYASGHGDVMGGAVIGRAELIDCDARRRGDPRADARSARCVSVAARHEDLFRALGCPVPECPARGRAPGEAPAGRARPLSRPAG